VTTTWPTRLDRLAVEDITRQARQIRPARTVLTWVGALLFGVGWLAFKIVTVAWLVAAWTFVAAREGWREARKAQVTRGAGRPD
jgi:hypothetical protein